MSNLVKWKLETPNTADLVALGFLLVLLLGVGLRHHLVQLESERGSALPERVLQHHAEGLEGSGPNLARWTLVPPWEADGGPPRWVERSRLVSDEATLFDSVALLNVSRAGQRLRPSGEMQADYSFPAAGAMVWRALGSAQDASAPGVRCSEWQGTLWACPGLGSRFHVEPSSAEFRGVARQCVKLTPESGRELRLSWLLPENTNALRGRVYFDGEAHDRVELSIVQEGVRLLSREYRRRRNFQTWHMTLPSELSGEVEFVLQGKAGNSDELRFCMDVEQRQINQREPEHPGATDRSEGGEEMRRVGGGDDAI